MSSMLHPNLASGSRQNRVLPHRQTSGSLEQDNVTAEAGPIDRSINLQYLIASACANELGNAPHVVAYAVKLYEEDPTILAQALINYLLSTTSSSSRLLFGASLLENVLTADHGEGQDSVASVVHFLYNNAGGSSLPALDMHYNSQDSFEYLPEFGNHFGQEIGDEPELVIEQLANINEAIAIPVNDFKEAILGSPYLDEKSKSEAVVKLFKATLVALHAIDTPILKDFDLNEILACIGECHEPEIEYRVTQIGSSTIFYDPNRHEIVNDGFIDIVQGPISSKFLASTSIVPSEAPLKNDKIKVSPHSSLPTGTPQPIRRPSGPIEPPRQATQIGKRNLTATTLDMIAPASISRSSKSKLPDFLPGESEEEYLIRGGDKVERSYRWHKIRQQYSKAEVDQLYPKGFTDPRLTAEIKQERDLRNAKFGILSKNEVKKVSISAIDKKLKTINVGEKQDGDDLAFVLPDMFTTSSVNSRFFETVSGHISYAVKLNNKMPNFSLIIDNMKGAFNINSCNVRCYQSLDYPIGDELKIDRNESPEASSWDKKDDETKKGPIKRNTFTRVKGEKKPVTRYEQKLCLIFVTDIVYDQIVMISDEAFIHMYDTSPASLKSEILGGIYQIQIFRWLTCCYEDFHTIFYNHLTQSIQGIGETHNVSGNNFRKDISTAISKFATAYKDFCTKHEKILKQKSDQNKFELMNCIGDYASIHLDSKKRRLKDDKSFPEINDNLAVYYSFIHRRMLNADHILEAQTW